VFHSAGGPSAADRPLIVFREQILQGLGDQIRAQARRMIEEAFAEREPQHVIAGKPMLRVIEHEAVDTEANGEEPTEREG
jgi:hypothetical protein